MSSQAAPLFFAKVNFAKVIFAQFFVAQSGSDISQKLFELQSLVDWVQFVERFADVLPPVRSFDLIRGAFSKSVLADSVIFLLQNEFAVFVDDATRLQSL